jgi:RNA polymerase sigma factor (sigma-70 family)
MNLQITSEKVHKLSNEEFDNDYHIELYNRMNGGDLSARWELVLAVTPLIKSRTRKFQIKWVKNNHDIDDFTHSIYEVVYHAASKWNPELSKWSYYSLTWLHEICAKFARQRLVVRQDEKRGKIPCMTYFDGYDESYRDSIFNIEHDFNLTNFQLDKLLENVNLNDREMFVINKHFFNNDTHKTIAENLKISRQRVVQIQESAFNKIKKCNGLMENTI